MNPYSSLGVSENATQDEIKNAYRKLAAKHHPDRGGDTKKFQEIQQAYDILTDENKRNEFFRSQQPQGGFDFNFSFGRNPFEDIFNQFARGPRQAIYTVTVFVSLEQVATGSKESIHINTPNGPKLIQIDIPKGIDDGTQIRYENLIPDGWLQILFRIHKHPIYERNGLDLLMKVDVNVFKLMTGSKIKVKDIFNSEIELVIPKGTKPMSRLRIANHGLINSGRIGDLYVLITPLIPDKISEELLELIKKEFKD